MLRLGVVSYLNSRPLIDGLEGRPDVSLYFDVPSALAARLENDAVQVALIPIFDVIAAAGRLHVLSDAGIACDGETMTVRVFSQVPPDRIRTLWVDGDSHTSINLARVLWRELYDTPLELRAFDSQRQRVDDCTSVLLIGDKVITGRRDGFAYEVDLGAAWRQHTGLPFVFAVWAAPGPAADDNALESAAALLCAARDRGVARAAEIAQSDGPRRWWPVDLATRYLTRCLKYRLDDRFRAGADHFAALCSRHGIVAPGAHIPWPTAGSIARTGS